MLQFIRSAHDPNPEGFENTDLDEREALDLFVVVRRTLTVVVSPQAARALQEALDAGKAEEDVWAEALAHNRNADKASVGADQAIQAAALAGVEATDGRTFDDSPIA